MKTIALKDAVAMIPDGASLMIGGFMAVGTPERLVVMATAADVVIVTAEHIVPVGVIAPDHVVTPAPLVDFLVTNE
jgi:acyl CoA:acetate/3-ketoacid CoA transferase alpha subunit